VCQSFSFAIAINGILILVIGILIFPINTNRGAIAMDIAVEQKASRTLTLTAAHVKNFFKNQVR
jgi:hypothetical protein